MSLKLRPTLLAGSVSAMILGLVACSVTSGSSNPPPSSSQVTVTVTGSATVTLGSTSQYAVTVKGSTNQAVNWTVNQAAGGNAQLGTISTTGLYSAPATMPSSASITIAAVSAADPTASNSIAVVLQSSVPPTAGAGVTVTGPATVNLGATGQYAAAVAGTQNQAVTWAVNGVAGGNATFGTIAQADSIRRRRLCPPPMELSLPRPVPELRRSPAL